MNTSETLTKQQWQDQEALHRFQMISPLLQTGLDDAERLLTKITFLSALFTGMRKHSLKNSSQVSDRQIAKNTGRSVFRKTSSIFWSRRSSFERKFRNGQLPRSFTSWKQKVLSLPVF